MTDTRPIGSYPPRYSAPSTFRAKTTNKPIDANLDPRDYWNLSDYVQNWLFCLGHNLRLQQVYDNDWDLVDEWWTEVETLREQAGEPHENDFAEYGNDGDRLVKAALVYTVYADHGAEAAQKLSWRRLMDTHERLKALYPDADTDPPAVTWHISVIVKILDIKNVPGGHVYELELTDERRLPAPVRFELDVQDDRNIENA